MKRDVLLVTIAALAQAWLGRWVASAWMVPDLLLVGMMIAMSARPEPRLRPAWLGGCWAMLLSVRRPLVVGVAYASAGWLMKALQRRWEMHHAAIQLALAAIAETLLVAVWCIVEGRAPGGAAIGGSTPIGSVMGTREWLGLMLAAFTRVGTTVACLALCHGAWRRLAWR